MLLPTVAKILSGADSPRQRRAELRRLTSGAVRARVQARVVALFFERRARRVHRGGGNGVGATAVRAIISRRRSLRVAPQRRAELPRLAADVVRTRLQFAAGSRAIDLPS